MSLIAVYINAGCLCGDSFFSSDLFMLLYVQFFHVALRPILSCCFTSNALRPFLSYCFTSISFMLLYVQFFHVALRPQKPYRLLGKGSPGRPPRLSSSWVLSGDSFGFDYAGLTPSYICAIKGGSHSFRITCDMCAVSLLESRE